MSEIKWKKCLSCLQTYITFSHSSNFC